MSIDVTDTPKEPKVPSIEGYFTLHEAADELGISIRTLQRWSSERVGPPRTKIGSLILYRQESFRAWLIAQEETSVRHRA